MRKNINTYNLADRFVSEPSEICKGIILMFSVFSAEYVCTVAVFTRRCDARNEKNLKWTNNGFLLFQLNKLRKLIVTYGDYSRNDASRRRRRSSPATVTVSEFIAVYANKCWIVERSILRSADPKVSPKQSSVVRLIVCVCVLCTFSRAKFETQVHKSLDWVIARHGIYIFDLICAMRTCHRCECVGCCATNSGSFELHHEYRWDLSTRFDPVAHSWQLKYFVEF